MNQLVSWLRLTELDRINLPDMAERIAQAEAEGSIVEPRSCPGYPMWRLPHSRRRWWPSFDAMLAKRRCARSLDTKLPDARTLGQLLESAHGITGEFFRGPTPSAGGLQAVELFVVNWQQGWLPEGIYHFDRVGHHLSQIVPIANSERWRELVPSLHQVEGGALLWLLIGDTQRVATKYGERGDRFLLLEAGHLMQNLCLTSTSLGLSTVPLGGCLEREVAQELKLPRGDSVLYAGVCGQPVE